MAGRLQAPALALVEGNRGLFDGLDASGSCSTAELARILQCPLLLCLDCTKMTRTAAAVLRGVLTFEPGLHFVGVVLNQVGSARHETIVRRALEAYTDSVVLGALPRLKRNPLPERHMGIASQGAELGRSAQSRLDALGDLVATHVDVAAVVAAAQAAPPLACAAAFWPALDAGLASSRPRIGYVRDKALWFYYEQNLEALERAGAELVQLSLVDDVRWPGHGIGAQNPLHGLYLGGGFPEDCVRALSASPHIANLGHWAAAGMPIYAECGGFMLLAAGIEREGRFWPMGNVFPVTAQFCDRPQGLGYVRATVSAQNPYFPTGMEIVGHEFHYSRCRWHRDDMTFGLRMHKGQGMGKAPKGDAGLVDALLYRNVWAAYSHVFAPTTPCWASNFTSVARHFAAASREGTAQ